MKRVPSLYLLCALVGAGCLMLTGCKEEKPESPNEKTAAPARLPGEDPHAHTIPGSNTPTKVK